jgi:hypothetical protein
MLINVKEELNRFAKYVVSQSRGNLTRLKKNVTKETYDSIKSNVKVSPNSFELAFLMNQSGVFQDKGVSGTKKKYNTKFSYKESSNLVGMEYHTGTFAKWAKARNIRLRDSKGRFKKGSYKSIGFIIARSVKEKGIKPSLFFTKPFEKAFKNIDKDLVKAYRLDIEQLLETSINNK